MVVRLTFSDDLQGLPFILPQRCPSLLGGSSSLELWIANKSHRREPKSEETTFAGFGSTNSPSGGCRWHFILRGQHSTVSIALQFNASPSRERAPVGLVVVPCRRKP